MGKLKRKLAGALQLSPEMNSKVMHIWHSWKDVEKMLVTKDVKQNKKKGRTS